ncbi:MAG: asparagine synthase-related protein [Phycisphaerae bacterium]
MSGLFGYFDPSNELPAEAAEKMADAMACPADQFTVILRGPRFAIGCVSKGVYPGEGELLTDDERGRLGLLTGRLLTSSQDGSAVDPVTAARRTLLEDPSPARLSKANGPFAAVIWDEQHGHLELITDRHGMYPIYLASCGPGWIFAGQLKAILAVRQVPLTLNPVAVALMLSIGELVDDITLLDAVHLAPAASKMTLRPGGSDVTCYWHYAFHQLETDFNATARRLGHSLRAAVERICSDTSRVGVPLSGGLDSRVLLAATPRPTQTPSFTWGSSGCRDLAYAADIARAVGSRHQGLVFDGGYLKELAPLGTWITEGQLPCTDFHVLPFVDLVGRSCDIILNGYAGDAVLGGRFVKRAWWNGGSRAAAGDALWNWRNTSLAPAYRSSLFGPALQGCGITDAKAAFINSYERTPGETHMDAAMAFLLDNRVRRFTSCGTSLLRWRLESDHPFFDIDFFDHASRLPHAWRYRHRIYLHMLKACFPGVAKLRWDRTGLPATASRSLHYMSLAVHRLSRYRPFQGLFRSKRCADFERWMRGPLRAYVVDVLEDPRTLDRGICEPNTLRKLIRDHAECNLDNSTALGCALAVELFARLFLDRDPKLLERCHVPAPRLRVVKLETVA